MGYENPDNSTALEADYLMTNLKYGKEWNEVH